MKVRVHEDPEAERAVLASIMIRPVGIAEIADCLSSADFRCAAYGNLYSAMLGLFLDKKGIDPVTLDPKLASGVLEHLGGQEGLIRLAEEEPTGLHVRNYADRVILASRKRKILEICRAVSSEPERLVEILREVTLEMDDARFDQAFVRFVSGLLGVSSDSWPDPEALRDELSTVQPFDLDLLPPRLRDAVVDIAERMQCPPDFPAVGIIISLGALVGRKIGIRPKREDDWTVAPNLWGAIIGRPSTLKSPSLQSALAPLTELEIEAKEEYRKECLEFEAEKIRSEEFSKSRRKEIGKSSSDRANALRLAREIVGDEPDLPVRKRLVVNDTSVEKLGELLSQNPNGLLIFRDEIVGLLRGLDKEGQESARAFYLEAWNGTSRFTWDRIGRGTVDIETAIVSIIGGIQPGPLRSYVTQAVEDGVGNDGLLQRFQLLVWPDLSPTWTNVDRKPDLSAHRAVGELVQRLYKSQPCDFDAIQPEKGENPIEYLFFSPDAQELFDQWRLEFENRLRSSQEHPAFESHLTKYRSLVPSLALLLHLADEGRGSVSRRALERALAWAEYLESHARRVYGAVSSSNVSVAHRIVAKMLKRKLKSPFSIRDVYRPQWSGLSNRKEVEEGVEVLRDYGWVKPILTKETKRRTLYLINPKIYEMPKKGTDSTDRREEEGHLSALSVTHKGVSQNLDGSGKVDPTVEKEPAPPSSTNLGKRTSNESECGDGQMDDRWRTELVQVSDTIAAGGVPVREAIDRARIQIDERRRVLGLDPLDTILGEGHPVQEILPGLEGVNGYPSVEEPEARGDRPGGWA